MGNLSFAGPLGGDLSLAIVENRVWKSYSKVYFRAVNSRETVGQVSAVGRPDVRHNNPSLGVMLGKSEKLTERFRSF